MATIYFALIIPLVVSGIFYYFNRQKIVWWEFFLPVAICLVAIVVSKVLIETASVKFTEYWGSTVVAVYESEPYNYWQTQTCSRSVPCGTDSKGNTQYCTEYYDCSHQVDVGPSWTAVTNLKEEIDISEKEYEDLKRQFKLDRTVVKTRDNYAPRDRCTGSRGTKFEGKSVGETSYVYEVQWNNQEQTRKSYVSKHRYENRIKASDLSIFHMSIVKEELADTLKLFKYPEYKNNILSNSSYGLYFPTILGGNVSNEIQEKFRNLNGKFGPTKELRLWILVFENKPISIATYQENYWVRGNMNELVICIGKKGNEIMWSYAFSWALSTDLTAEVKNEVMNLYTYKDSVIKTQLPPIVPTTGKTAKKVLGKELAEKLPPVMPIPKEITKNVAVKDSIIKVRSPYPVLTEETWNRYHQFLDKNLQNFKRRDFKEFDYISVDPSIGWIIFVYVLTILISVGVNLWSVNNEYDNENN